MKILNTTQIKSLDKQTIKEQNLASTELMERASKVFVKWFISQYSNQHKITIFCGIGDNGGDGLAVARLLYDLDYEVEVFVIRFSEKTSKDFKINYNRLEYLGVSIGNIRKGEELPKFNTNSITIDAILGSGLSRPVTGWLAGIIKEINDQASKIISIDIASGVFADQFTATTSILPLQTFCFELPKLAFLFPSNQNRVGEWYIDSIQSSINGIESAQTSFYYITPSMVKRIYRPRAKFAHKGTFGHTALIVGSYGMIGAGLLAAKAALRTGAGLVSAHIPNCGYQIAQTAIPELMVQLDDNEWYFTGFNFNKTYYSIGIGCGLGQHIETQKGLKKLLEQAKQPLVIDADALNIIAKNNWLNLIPKNSILTPHVKEFERLFGQTSNDFERNQVQRLAAQEHEIYIILKGAHTAIACPDGNCYFNSTGNAGMATAGSGDVLTGILTSFLGQGYNAKETCLLGVYLHGLAGDLAIQTIAKEALIASDIIAYISVAFKDISNFKLVPLRT